MPNALKFLVAALVTALCFVIGLHAGPHASSTYHRLFPEPEYRTGDFSALYAQAGHDIVMYSNSTCPYCTRARALFVEKGIKFTKYQVDKSKAAAAEFQKRGGRYVPLLYIGEREISGFREQAILDAVSAIDEKS